MAGSYEQGSQGNQPVTWKNIIHEPPAQSLNMNRRTSLNENESQRFGFVVLIVMVVATPKIFIQDTIEFSSRLR